MDKTYIGKISNNGQQIVTAPVPNGKKCGKPVAHKGGDLRANKSKG